MWTQHRSNLAKPFSARHDLFTFRSFCPCISLSYPHYHINSLSLSFPFNFSRLTVDSDDTHNSTYSQSNRCEFSASTHFHACRAKMMMMMIQKKKRKLLQLCGSAKTELRELTAMLQMIYDASDIAHLKPNNISTKRDKHRAARKNHQQ